MDQHLLIALIAPRLVSIARAGEDQWADPHGAFLATKHADPMVRLLGSEDLAASAMPALS